MARIRRDADSFTMSFLDIMCCGFGAIVLLIMLSKTSEFDAQPSPLEVSETPTSGSVLNLQRQLFALRGETNILNRDLNAKQEQLSEYTERIARLLEQIVRPLDIGIDV